MTAIAAQAPRTLWSPRGGFRYHAPGRQKMTQPSGPQGVDALAATFVADEPAAPSAAGQVCTVGRVYAGQYLVKGLLGQGGMGEVYLVEHQTLHAEFALKVLRPTYRIREDIVQRFRAESRALWELSHPNFVRVHHAGEDPEIGPYMAMEVLQGKTLAQLLFVLKRLSIEQALSLAIEVADTAEAMHQLGIIHRDLKPENLFLTARGPGQKRGVKLLDLGAAKIAKYGGPATAENRTIGTGKYMSPEHIRSKPLGPPADIYALGHIVFEAIAGSHVFGQNHPNPTHFDYQLWHLNAEPDSLSSRVPEAPEDLSAVLKQAMAKQPEHRFQSMAAFASALREVLRRLIANRAKGGTEQMSKPPVDDAATIEQALLGPSPDGSWSMPVAGANGTHTADVHTARDPISRGLGFAARVAESSPRLTAALATWVPLGAPGAVVELAPQSYLIGSAPHADIVVTDPGMAFEHARLTVHPTGIIEIAAAAGARLLVNDVPETHKALRHCDRVTLGNRMFELRLAAGDRALGQGTVRMDSPSSGVAPAQPSAAPRPAAGARAAPTQAMAAVPYAQAAQARPVILPGAFGTPPGQPAVGQGVAPAPRRGLFVLAIVLFVCLVILTLVALKTAGVIGRIDQALPEVALSPAGGEHGA